MLFAHMPAGYVSARLLGRRLEGGGVPSSAFIAAAMAGAIAPDGDLLMFWLLPHDPSLSHHQFWPHWPLVWIALLLGCGLLARRDAAVAALAGIFCFNGLLHTLLDLASGRSIYWLLPFDDQRLSLYLVPIKYQSTLLYSWLHHILLVELAITLWALWLLHRPQPQMRNAMA